MLERLFATRKGAVAVGLAAAAVALVLLLVYVKQYRHNVSATAQTTQVLVARSLIQKGTPGNVVGRRHLYELRAVPKDTVQLGALIDPASLRTGVALNNIFPGQQLVAGDFGVPTNVLDTTISGVSGRSRSRSTRAGRSNGQIEAGDHVDIYYAQSGAANACSTVRRSRDPPGRHRHLARHPAAGRSRMQVDPTEAARLAYATDNGKLWFTLRGQGRRSVPGACRHLREARPSGQRPHRGDAMTAMPIKLLLAVDKDLDRTNIERSADAGRAVSSWSASSTTSTASGPRSTRPTPSCSSLPRRARRTAPCSSSTRRSARIPSGRSWCSPTT